MKIFPTDFMKTMVIINHTKDKALILQSICESSIDFLYNLELEERGWQNDNIEVMFKLDTEIGGELSIEIGMKPEKKEKTLSSDEALEIN